MCSPHLGILFLVNPRATDLFLFLPPGKANAALEWQAGSLGWRGREQMVACPLEGLVGWLFTTRQLNV